MECGSNALLSLGESLTAASSSALASWVQVHHLQDERLPVQVIPIDRDSIARGRQSVGFTNKKTRNLYVPMGVMLPTSIHS